MKINLAIIYVSIVVLVSLVLTFNSELRWIGHLTAGAVMLGFAGWSVFYGLVLAGRIKRPPNHGVFQIHRVSGIAFSTVAVFTFIYGLLIMLPQGKNLLATPHGWLGLIIAVISLIQVIPRLVLKIRAHQKDIHRWTAYLLSVLVIVQITLGITVLPMFDKIPAVPDYTMPWQTPVEEPWSPDGIILPGEYHGLIVVDNGSYEINFRNDGTYFYAGVRVKTVGWIGIGIAVDESMLDAGMFFGYVSEGKAVVIDSFGVSKFAHKPDIELGGTADIPEFGGVEENGWTVIEFKFPLLTVDKYDIPLAPGLQKIIWAYGTADSPGMHAVQGYLDIEFTAG